MNNYQQYPQQPQYSQGGQAPPQMPGGYAPGQGPVRMMPPQSYGVPRPVKQQWNTLCIVGFVLCFIAPPVGLVLSIIALVQINKTGENNKTMAIAGISVGAALSILSILIVFYVFVFIIGITSWILDYSIPEDVVDYDSLAATLRAVYQALVLVHA
ncbi:DUF4190 domain-containing protein [Bifidobacterium gallicum]|uniref:DUF4190 domain-containing protein n=1 Tax=Bifidobacterium gallicum DSM 20093 = LMG 11596 TaxID=561180 RepID=D1NV24_9BIFI|nr:DUF4190 domain-containing protein [Bifidobacterium gallicum]EFA22675.1 hypothetical protein BIFGAL_03705 [Bifidobacterium gallicum DSM 20093 = LMG 11596]